MKNGFGVVLDDVLAGVYAALALRLTLSFFPLG
jgi:phosphatidylglycerophosphatase A